MKIALTGISGAGKDYLGKVLLDEMEFERISFSDELKSIASRIYPWLEFDYEPSVKNKPLNITTNFGIKIEKSPRDIWLALDFLRTIDPFVFIYGVDNRIEMYEKERNILITDIRTQQEFDFCKSKGFTTIFIQPTKEIYKKYSFDYFSRSSKENCDFIFENTFQEDSKYKFLEMIKKEL